MKSNSVKSFSEKKKTDSENDFTVSGFVKSVYHSELSTVSFSFSSFLLPVQFK